jgi:hypothetical protein
MNTSLAASSRTDCKEQPLLFQCLGSRNVVADFSGGALSSDGGALLLRQVDIHLGLTQSLARCFRDTREQVYVDHSVRQLLTQRLYGLALGCEDLNDHQRLRLDPLLAAACDKLDPLGRDRFNPAHRGIALAGAGTLNRLELSNNKNTRGHKLSHEPGRIETCLLQMGVRCLPKYAQEIVLDLDAMGHRLNGMQEGRHFRAYHDEYCYLPLYAFVGDVPLWAQLRTGDKDGADGVVATLEKIVQSDSETLPPGADHRARGQRFLPGGDPGVVRKAGGSLLVSWIGQKLCLGRAPGTRPGPCPNPLVPEAERPTCASSPSLTTRPSRVGVAAAGSLAKPK